MSIFKLFGDGREVPLGIYDEFLVYDGILSTNIYTVFRGLITDFSLVGSLFLGLLAGFICHLFYYLLLVKDRWCVFSVFFIYFFAVAYQSYVVSSLTWLSVPVSFFIVIFALALFSRRDYTGFPAVAE